MLSCKKYTIIIFYKWHIIIFLYIRIVIYTLLYTEAALDRYRIHFIIIFRDKHQIYICYNMWYQIEAQGLGIKNIFN